MRTSACAVAEAISPRYRQSDADKLCSARNWESPSRRRSGGLAEQFAAEFSRLDQSTTLAHRGKNPYAPIAVITAS